MKTQGEQDQSEPEAPNAAPGATDFALKTRHLDEFEHVCTQTITHHRYVALTRTATDESELEVHGMGDIAVFKMRFGRSISADVQSDGSGRIGFVMARKGGGHLILDGEVTPVSTDAGAMVTAEQNKTFQYPHETEIVSLILNSASIAKHCEKILGRELELSLDFATRFALSEGAGRSWQRLVQYAADEFSDPHSLARNVPAARVQLEQMLMTGLLFSQPHTHLHALLTPQSAAAPAYVKRAEAFIEANYAKQISLADIAAHVGVSARSLQNGFQNFRGTTPMAFLRSVRLNRVHRELLASDPATQTVTRVAMQAGFNHMGEFATQYRRIFDTTPRQTLARAMGR
jgi:AraC-like DNA-binding protein